MIDRGYVPDFRAAFDRYLKDGGPAYIVVDRTPPAEAVAAIRAAGGTATVAHPRQIDLEDDDAWDAFFGELVDAGLAGIEVHHPSHKRTHRAYFGALADRHGLVQTGGSDFHGSNKPRIRLGTGNGTIDVRYETWQRLRERREPRGT
jgi:predicted metal-dependent phosphoesterase TrpH